jgi:hypothetical protein
MRKLRFNIASLLVLILVLGVSFAALRESSDLWESGLFTGTVGILLISVLLAVHRTEARRAFWIGFALFGWIYVGLALAPSVESRLITTKLLAYLDSKVPGRQAGIVTLQISGTGPGAANGQIQNLAFTIDGSQLATSSWGKVKLWNVTTGKLLGGWGGTTENFVRIGHSLFALLVGSFGGKLARRLCQASSPTEIPAPVAP